MLRMLKEWRNKTYMYEFEMEGSIRNNISG